MPVGHTSGINDVAIAPNGKYAISGSEDKTVRLWEVETGREIQRRSATA
ncbi:WD40 repeat domain-containing protein [Larkinella sp.]